MILFTHILCEINKKHFKITCINISMSYFVLYMFVILAGNPSGVFPITATSVQRDEMNNDNLGIISAALRNAGSSHNSVLRIGSVAIFNCTAKESLPPPTIRWCMRGPSEDTFRNFAFASVQRLEMVNSSIPEESCFFATTSLLPFVITSADNGTQLTCSTDTADCESSPRSNMESIFTIIVSGKL